MNNRQINFYGIPIWGFAWVLSTCIAAGCQINKTENKQRSDTTPAFVFSKVFTIFQQHQHESSFQYKNDSLGVFIGPLFEKDRKHAVLCSYPNDKTTELLVLELRKSRWDTVLSKQVETDHESPAASCIAEFTDFNGDAIPDLKLPIAWWDVHPGENSLLWLYQNGLFNSIDGFEEIASAEYVAAEKLIVSYESDGCADMNMIFSTYRIVENKVVPVSVINCDCCLLETTGKCTLRNLMTEDEKLLSPEKVSSHVPAIYRELVREKCAMVSGGN